MSRLLSLDVDAALDPLIVGGKAARLAAARRAGLPVLRGLVVSSRDGWGAMEAGRQALEAGQPATARSAARRAPMADGLAPALAGVGRLGRDLVVRSSTRLDDDGRWAGAFATFGHVSPEDVATACRGCWASVFAPGVLARLDETGLDPSDVGMAVLIQPCAHPTGGGWTRLTPGGVEVAMVDGSPAPLMSGHATGLRCVIGSDGRLAEGTLPAALAECARDVAALARRAKEALGATHLELAVVDGGIVLFQLGAPGRTGRDDAPVAAEPLGFAGGVSRPDRAASEPFPGRDQPAFRRLAAALVMRRGPLAERLVAPWAAAVSGPLVPLRAVGSFAELMGVAAGEAGTLEQEVAERVGLTAADLVEGLARGDLGLGARLDGIPIETARAGLVLGACAAAADLAAGAGWIEYPAQLWWQSPAWIARAIGGDPPPAAARPALDRFTELIVEVTRNAGTTVRGTAAGPGRAAGRPTFLEDPEAGHLQPGGVLVVDDPLPAFSPLLWRAAGLVARRGSPAAHLCEVARSLRVPSVVGANLLPGPSALGAEACLALDGESGDLWVADL